MTHSDPQSDCFILGYITLLFSVKDAWITIGENEFSVILITNLKLDDINE